MLGVVIKLILSKTYNQFTNRFGKRTTSNTTIHFQIKKQAVLNEWFKHLKKHSGSNLECKEITNRWIFCKSLVINIITPFILLLEWSIKMLRRQMKNYYCSKLFFLDDFVIIIKYRKVFLRGYTPNWSNESYKVIIIMRTTIREGYERNQIRGEF